MRYFPRKLSCVILVILITTLDFFTEVKSFKSLKLEKCSIIEYILKIFRALLGLYIRRHFYPNLKLTLGTIVKFRSKIGGCEWEKETGDNLIILQKKRTPLILKFNNNPLQTISSY